MHILVIVDLSLSGDGGWGGTPPSQKQHKEIPPKEKNVFFRALPELPLPLQLCVKRLCNFIHVFSVTRRSRSDSRHLLTHLLIVSTDLTDVTLVSDDTY